MRRRITSFPNNLLPNKPKTNVISTEADHGIIVIRAVERPPYFVFHFAVADS